jgi:hypothetical protein
MQQQQNPIISKYHHSLIVIITCTLCYHSPLPSPSSNPTSLEPLYSLCSLLLAFLSSLSIFRFNSATLGTPFSSRWDSASCTQGASLYELDWTTGLSRRRSLDRINLELVNDEDFLCCSPSCCRCLFSGLILRPLGRSF